MMISTFTCLLLALITAHFPANVCGDGEEDLEEGNSHFGYCGAGGRSIAHCKYLDFTFLPFTFLPFERGRRTWKRETRTSVTGRGGRALHIANSLTLPFYLLPFYLLRWRTEQSAGLIQRRRVHGPPVMDWMHPAIRDRVDVL